MAKINLNDDEKFSLILKCFRLYLWCFSDLSRKSGDKLYWYKFKETSVSKSAASDLTIAY